MDYLLGEVGAALLEARVRPGARNLLAVDIWVDVLLEARVRPGAWNLLAVVVRRGALPDVLPAEQVSA